jgi:epoxyqueuosine reductase
LDKPVQYRQRIIKKALELDFLDCGIARAEFLKEDAVRLRNWLCQGFNGDMEYMGNHFDKRTDPRKLVEGARSLIVVLENYYTDELQSDPGAPVISKYAYGRDYHKIILKKLNSLLRWIQDEISPVTARAFVDFAPVLEKAVAARAGLGWIGKHSLLLNRKYGSWFFIGVIVSDLELEPDKPVKENCGDCTKCIDACPTSAILPGCIIDATRCISYLTAELKRDEIPAEFRNRMNNRAFGCDICQDACPWNKNAHPHNEAGHNPRPGLLEMSRMEWMNLDEKKFNELFEGSAVKRAGFSGLRRNLDFLQ